MKVRDPRSGPFLIGLTGPIGCGKSTVAAMLARLGGVAVDADELAHRVTAPGSDTLGAIRQCFGDEVFDASGALDRAALARRVFSDPSALEDLEAIVHPRVRVLVDEALARAEADGAPFVLLEAIKLFEGGLADRCDEVWLVTCEPFEQRQRLLDRGMDPHDIERRTVVQGGLRERLASRADRVISTSGDLEATRERVEDALADALAEVISVLPLGDQRQGH